MFILNSVAPQQCFCQYWKRYGEGNEKEIEQPQIYLYQYKTFANIKALFKSLFVMYNDMVAQTKIKNPERFGSDGPAKIEAWNERKKNYFRAVTLAKFYTIRVGRTPAPIGQTGNVDAKIPTYRTIMAYVYPDDTYRPDIFVIDMYQNKQLNAPVTEKKSTIGTNYAFTKTRVTNMVNELTTDAKIKLAETLGMTYTAGVGKQLESGTLVSWMNAWDAWETSATKDKPDSIPNNKFPKNYQNSNFPQSKFHFKNNAFSYFVGNKLEYDICNMVTYYLNTMLRQNKLLKQPPVKSNNYVDDLFFLDNQRQCFNEKPKKLGHQPVGNTVRPHITWKSKKFEPMKLPQLTNFKDQMSKLILRASKKSPKKVVQPKPQVLDKPKTGTGSKSNTKGGQAQNKKKGTIVKTEDKQLLKQKTPQVVVTGGNQKSPQKIENIPQVTIDLQNPNEDTQEEEGEDDNEEEEEEPGKGPLRRETEEDTDLKNRIVEQVLVQSFTIVRKPQETVQDDLPPQDKEVVQTIAKDVDNRLSNEEEQEEENPIPALVAKAIIETVIPDNPVNEDPIKTPQVLVKEPVVEEVELPDILSLDLDLDRDYYDMISKVESDDPESFSMVAINYSILMKTSTIRLAPRPDLDIAFSYDPKTDSPKKMEKDPQMFSDLLQTVLQKLYHSQSKNVIDNGSDARGINPLEMAIFSRYCLFKRILEIWNLALNQEITQEKSTWIWPGMSLIVYRDGTFYSRHFRGLRKLLIHALCYHRYMQMFTIEYTSTLEIWEVSASENVQTVDDSSKANVLKAALTQNNKEALKAIEKKVKKESSWQSIRSKITVQNLAKEIVLVKLLELTNPNGYKEVNVCSIFSLLLREWVSDTPQLKNKKILFVDAITWECQNIDEPIKQFGSSLISSLERRLLGYI